MKRFKFSVFLTTSIFAMFVNFNLLAQGTTAPTSPAVQPAKATAPAPTSAAAIKPSTFFLGKWDVLVLGLPQGDTHMPTVFEMKKDSATNKDIMVGRIESKETGVAIPLTDIVATDSTMDFAFSAQGYDLTMTLAKKDNDNAAGTMFNMFSVKAIRIKE